MDNNFTMLFGSVDELREKQEKRENIKAAVADARRKADDLVSDILQKYREEESRIDEQTAQAEAKNERHKADIVRLEKERIKAGAGGGVFAHKEELAEAKAEVATYPQTLEALQELKKEIFVPLAEVERLEEIRREWGRLTREQSTIESEMQEILIKIKNTDVLNCLATFEVIPGLRSFLSDENGREYEALQKEDAE